MKIRAHSLVTASFDSGVNFSADVDSIPSYVPGVLRYFFAGSLPSIPNMISGVVLLFLLLPLIQARVQYLVRHFQLKNCHIESSDR